MLTYAQHFWEIEDTVAENSDVRERALELVSEEPFPGKVTQGEGRSEALRELLAGFFKGELSYDDVEQQIPQKLPRRESPHKHDKRTFPKGWPERLARTQISRFYNKAVLELLAEAGDDEVFIPHSEHEDYDTQCTIHLAGGTGDIDMLLDRLDRAYHDGNWHEQPMVPNHPHCTHTVVPSDGCA